MPTIGAVVNGVSAWFSFSFSILSQNKLIETILKNRKEKKEPPGKKKMKFMGCDKGGEEKAPLDYLSIDDLPPKFHK